MEQNPLHENSHAQGILQSHNNKALSGTCRDLVEALSKAEEKVQRCLEQCQTWRTKRPVATADPTQKLQILRPALETLRSRRRICGVEDILENVLAVVAVRIESAQRGNSDPEASATLTSLEARLIRSRNVASGILAQLQAQEREMAAEIEQLSELPPTLPSPTRGKAKDDKTNVVAKTFGNFFSRMTSGIDKISSGMTQSVKRTQDKVVAGISKVAKDVKNLSNNKPLMTPEKMTPDLRRLVAAGALTPEQARQLMSSKQLSPMRRRNPGKSGPSVASLLVPMTSKLEQKKYFLDIVAGGDVRSMIEFTETLVRVHHLTPRQLFVPNADGTTDAEQCPVFTAVRNGHLMAARWLVAASFAGGASRNNSNPRLDGVYHPLGTTLMHVAAAAGFLHIVKWLHNTHGVSLEVQDTRGATPFLVACSTGASESGAANDVEGETAAFVLIQMGIKVEHVDAQGCNCLHYAALGGQFNLLRRLWRRTNVSINAEDRHGRSTFQVACMTASSTDVEWFCNQLNERQVASKDKQGRTAVDIAEFFKNEEACKWLRGNVEAFKN